MKKKRNKKKAEKIALHWRHTKTSIKGLKILRHLV